MQRHKAGRWPCEDRGKDWNHAATGQGTPGATWSWKSKGRILPYGFRGSMAPLKFSLNCGLPSWTMKKYIYVVLNHPVCCGSPQKQIQITHVRIFLYGGGSGENFSTWKIIIKIVELNSSVVFSCSKFELSMLFRDHTAPSSGHLSLLLNLLKRYFPCLQ